MNIKTIQNLIEKAILSSKKLIIEYTNSKKEKDSYKIEQIRSTWDKYFRTIAQSQTQDKKASFKCFRYDRISSINISDEDAPFNEYIITRLNEGSLFKDKDDKIKKKGGIRYPSSINYSMIGMNESKKDIEKVFKELDIPVIDGWKRGFVYRIYDGDTFEIISEEDKKVALKTRLYGVDAPEYKDDLEDDFSLENKLGLQSKIFVEDMFKDNAFCYFRAIKGFEKDSYRRYLFEIMNHEEKNIGLELLKNGLGFPMVSYFSDKETKNKYLAATEKGYIKKENPWMIPSIFERYKNILNDKSQTNIEILKHIPNKDSAINKYLKQKPEIKIYEAALNRKKRKIQNIKEIKKIFEKMIYDLKLDEYNVEEYKKFIDRYLKVMKDVELHEDNVEKIQDFIMQIEDYVDALNLGEGEIKGNFSKFSTRLVYHIKGNKYYEGTVPEILFKTEEDAKYCGFKKSKV